MAATPSASASARPRVSRRQFLSEAISATVINCTFLFRPKHVWKRPPSVVIYEKEPALHILIFLFHSHLALPEAFTREPSAPRRRTWGDVATDTSRTAQRRRLLAPERARGSLASTPGRSTSWANRVVLVLPFAFCGET